MSDQPDYTYPNQPQPPQYAGQYQQTPQYQQGAYAGYTQMYGQQLPEHMEKPVAPKALKIGAFIMYCIAGLTIISDILEIFFYDEIQAQIEEAVAALLGVPDFSSMAGTTTQLEGSLLTVSLVTGLILSLIWNGGAAVITFFMMKGHNWARIVATIYALLVSLGIFSVFVWLLLFHWSMLIGLLASVLAIVALFFFWQGPANEYMRQSRIYKQWVEQQSYFASHS
ncbi:hypothetical protein ACN08Y_02085 [Rothia sp. P5764]|uniref:hypothetical protein n=1 Tax=Rothia sp. P5764 TaxID=3402654 RepID=UPI003AD26FD4